MADGSANSISRSKSMTSSGSDRFEARSSKLDQSGQPPPRPLARPNAASKVYESEVCNECGNFTLVRNGTCLKCDTCGGTFGTQLTVRLVCEVHAKLAILSVSVSI